VERHGREYAPVIFGPTDAQERLRGRARTFLAEVSPPAEVRRLMEGGTGYDLDVWLRMAADHELAQTVVTAAQAVQAQLAALKTGEAEDTIVFAPTGEVVVAAGAKGGKEATAALRKIVSADANDVTAYREILDAHGRTAFTGYDEDESTATIVGILERAGAEGSGDSLEVFLDRTPFYAQGGGQVGDMGTITTPTGTLAVEDTTAPLPGLHRHIGRVTEGEIAWIGVRPEAQGRGLGRELLRWGVARLRAYAPVVYLTVNVTNPRALALYERHGFVRTAEKPRWARPVDD